MSYYLQGLGAAFPPSGMNVANTSIANSAMTTMATVYRDPQMSYRPITCSPGTVLDASGTGCVSPLRCSGGSILNIKTGQCVFPNKAAPIDFTAVRKLTYAKPVMTDLTPTQKVADCAAQGGILNPQTGECAVPHNVIGQGDLPALCTGSGGVWINGACNYDAIRPPEPDRTMLYVGLGVAAVAAIAIGVVMMKKRSDA